MFSKQVEWYKKSYFFRKQSVICLKSKFVFGTMEKNKNRFWYKLQKMARGGYGMKKEYRCLAICFAIGITFGLTSCAAAQPVEIAAQKEMTPKMYITQAVERLQETESYTGRMEVLTKTATESYCTVAQVTQTSKPLKVRIDESYTYGDSKILTKTYMEEDEDNVNLYRQYDELWTAISLPKEEAIHNMQFFDVGGNLRILLEKGQDWKQQEHNEQQTIVSGRISAEAVYDVINQTNLLQLSGVNGISETYFSGV